jgi:hypothetical protein
MLFREITTVYSESHIKTINTLCGQNYEFFCVRKDGTYKSHSALKG